MEIDLAAIESMAREVDTLAAQQPEERKPKRVKAKEVEVEEVEELPEALRDPEFEAMVKHGTDKGLDFMQRKLRLMEPGITTRTKVGYCVFRIIQRIQPVEPGPWADAATALGYVALWVLLGRIEDETRQTAD